MGFFFVFFHIYLFYKCRQEVLHLNLSWALRKHVVELHYLLFFSTSNQQRYCANRTAILKNKIAEIFTKYPNVSGNYSLNYWCEKLSQLSGDLIMSKLLYFFKLINFRVRLNAPLVWPNMAWKTWLLIGKLSKGDFFSFVYIE